ncbi:hypothetical protein VTL71DRAFT_6431 [Oculimacula yallundae]|uniref:Uncharacterized protein n=1 Tax=Oculimacula yallundae TaxID=86028 RepID=A0ABR4BWX8_9HELO
MSVLPTPQATSLTPLLEGTKDISISKLLAVHAADADAYRLMISKRRDETSKRNESAVFAMAVEQDASRLTISS